jgi:hypothetical protein
MIHSVKDLSPEQRLAVENLLGHQVSENERIGIRALSTPSAPEWLRAIRQEAREKGVDRMTPEEIDAEIRAARRDRGEGPRRPGR